ncbi:hypothetical protein [Salinispira pacifica]|uniref:Uncharacterized protein n=1 Tax=Salinispira pacifica TaxID=1307761 RepID=V5WIM6_9SPIO|nr:hypothetical protein [Salinispira pacifica]AHC15480.1 hypothetical protein L21SP2_2113 [Salinispira pacifica]
METTIRPEELIAEIYRQLHEAQSRGKNPDTVLMSLDQYRLLDWYRNFLGETPEGGAEYLEKYAVFGLEILIEQVESPQVQ